jgi:hypothetical protein
MKEALGLITPEHKLILQALMQKHGVSDSISAKEMFRRFSEDLSLTPEELDALIPLLQINKYKFAPKMDFTQRCQILALYRKGFSSEVLARIYKINRRTLTHIYNPNSPHYKNVREQLTVMGLERFKETYATPEVVRTALAYESEYDRTKEVNNKHANGKQGVHVVRNNFCNYDHRVIIQWVEAGERNITVSGWYYRDLDSDFPEEWFTAGGPESLRNSQACFSAMLTDITDRLG